MIAASRDEFWRGNSLCNSMFTNGLPALYGSQVPCCLPPFDCAAGSPQLEQYTHKALLRFIVASLVTATARRKGRTEPTKILKKGLMRVRDGKREGWKEGRMEGSNEARSKVETMRGDRREGEKKRRNYGPKD